MPSKGLGRLQGFTSQCETVQQQLYSGREKPAIKFVVKFFHGQFELERDETSVLGNVAKSEMWKLIIDKFELVCRTCV